MQAAPKRRVWCSRVWAIADSRQNPKTLFGQTRPACRRNRRTYVPSSDWVSLIQTIFLDNPSRGLTDWARGKS
ncbi:hypothetical protein O6P43_008627 [Quillaja saponaria]|uniref:Uncharacterized protein n=1 Tax=Quillaja saponaria TaxID=32244 RepID=A0AAD7M7S7_QUISA|nr:hypothetical protein O6P43_008627 [Quillaja saponaria]